MNREVHVRFWESAGLRCPAPLDYRQDYRNMVEAKRLIGRFVDRRCAPSGVQCICCFFTNRRLTT